MNRFKPFRIESGVRPLTVTGFVASAQEHPSDIWRMIEPWEVAKVNGHSCWVALRGNQVVHPPDIIVMRASFLDVRYAESFIRQCEADKVLVVIDYDDNYHGLRENDAIANRIPDTLRLAHVVTATTAQLADEIMSYSGRNDVWVIPNAINLDNWRNVKPPDPDCPLVTLVGSQSHETDWAIVPEVITTLADRFPHLRFRIAGCEPGWLNDFEVSFGSDRLERKPWVRFHDYPTLLEDSTIILAPLVDSLLNRGRSPIRFWEATCAGAAFIGSPLVYRDFVRDGETGYLSDSAEDTIECTSRLLEWSALREEMISLARQEVLNHRLDKETVDARFDVYYSEWQARYGASTEMLLSEANTSSSERDRASTSGGWPDHPVNRFRPVLPRDQPERARLRQLVDPKSNGSGLRVSPDFERSRRVVIPRR